MFKPNNKKMLTVLITLAMVFSALAVLSLAAQPAYATAGGTITLNPTTFGESSGIPVATLVTANGGTFGSGSTVYFYLSSTSSSSGITIGGYTGYIGSVSLPGGSTTLSNTVVTLFSGATVALPTGSYYILASDSSSPTATGAQFTSAVPVTVVSTQPSITISSTSPFTVGEKVYFSGTGWDPGASVSVYLNYAGGTVLTSFTATSTGFVPANEFFVVPAVSGTVPTSGSYSPAIPPLNVIAQETNTLSSSFPEGGITADAVMNVEPSITVSPESTQGAAGSAFTITGSGFVAGQVIPGFTSTSSGTSSITIASQNTLYSQVTVGNDGSFTVTVTLATAIPSSNYASQGINGQSVVISPTGPSGPSTFTGVIYVSSPGVSPALYISPTSGSSGEPITFVVVGFPASTSVSIYFGSSVFKATTDSNGFASLSSVIPVLQGGSYTIEAVGGGYSAAAAFSALSYTVSITDSSGLPLNGEYTAVGSVVTVNAQGLKPYEAITTLYDSGLGTTSYGSNLFTANQSKGYPIKVLNGSVGTASFEANGLGIFTISYAIDYKGLTTGTSETITIGSSTISSSVTATYKAVSKASVGTFATSYAPLSSVSLSITGLIPTGSPITPETSKWIGPFSITIDGSVVKLSTGLTTFTSTSGSASVAFLLPSSVGNGVHTFVLQSASSLALYTNYELIVSTPSASSGTIVNSVADSVIVGGTGTLGNPFTGYPDLSSGANNYSYGAKFDLYNFPSSVPITLTVYGSGGSYKTQVTTDANGGASVFVPFPKSVGNMPFLIQFSRTSVTITGANWYYEDIPAVAFDVPSFLNNGGMPATDYYSFFGSTAPAGSTVTFYANSLLPDTAYNVFVNTSSSFSPSDLVTSFVTGSDGDYSGVSFSLSDYLTTGTYYIDVSPASSSATSTSLFLTIEVTQLAPAYGFPGQLVPVNIPIPSLLPGLQYYTVDVFLNSTIYQSYDVYPISVLPSGYSIGFAFTMPNGQPGNYWYITYQYAPVTLATNTVTTATTAYVTGTPAPLTYTGLTAAAPTAETGTTSFTEPTGFTGVSGVTIVPGASTTILGVTGFTWSVSSGTVTLTYYFTVETTGSVTTATISSISAEVTEATTSTVSVQTTGSFTSTTLGYRTTLVSNSSAIITGITSGDIAEIVASVSNAVKTSMQVPLSELNASVVSINNAVATIKTAFGNMTATLKAINASVSAISGDLATVQTDLGSVQTTLSSINASIAAINGSVATIKTSVGVIQTSLNNLAPVISDINGTVMMINTTVGNINMNLTEFSNMIVKAINNGTATVTGSINGMNVTMQSSLSAINAKIVSLNGSVATVNTTLGQVKTTLSSINTQVISNGNGIVTVRTDLGNITGVITSANGNISTIKTALGTITVNVADINNNVTKVQNYGLIIDVVIIVLVAITLGIATASLISTRDLKRRFGMKKE